jgi:hypothetical protein
MRNRYDILDDPPGGADISWLWSELPPLREWLVRQFARFGYTYDPDRIIGKVVTAALTQRPDLKSVPRADYLHVLVEKFVLTDPE